MAVAVPSLDQLAKNGGPSHEQQVNNFNTAGVTRGKIATT
jgi:hypothetical protein